MKEIRGMRLPRAARLLVLAAFAATALSGCDTVATAVMQATGTALVSM